MAQVRGAQQEQEPVELTIDGWVYDVTEFRRRHPGGSVINFYKGLDATDSFEAFHNRSESAAKYLKALPRRPVKPSDADDMRDEPVVADYRALVQELKDEGLYNAAVGAQILRCIEMVAVYLLSFYVMVNHSWTLGGIIFGFGIGRNGLLMHDMGHRAFFGNMYWDKLAHLVVFNMGTTGSATFWCNQHNKHHAATQELEHDTDLITLPVVAFNKETAKEGAHIAWYLRWQWLSFFPLQLLLFHYWRFTHGRHALRTRNWPEAALIAAHYAFSFWMCWSQGLVGWLIYENIGYSIGGFYLATVFSMNHTHRPVVPRFERRSWLRRSIETTTNVTPTWFAQWITGYLCFQIEHHLFPSIPHPNLPKVAPKVKALLAKHGLTYDCKDMGDALHTVIKNLKDVGSWVHEEYAPSLASQEASKKHH